jgi:hypothetical protein
MPIISDTFSTLKSCLGDIVNKGGVQLPEKILISLVKCN